MFNTRPIQDICPESLRNKLCESHKNKKLCPNRAARKDIEFFIVTNTLAYFVKKQNLHFGVKCKIWWNKESVILKTYLKYFSMEKYIGVCRKEDILKHATSLTS